MNTAEIIRKVTMTILLTNQLEQKFRMSQNSLSILFSQRKVSLCERNTHVSSLLVDASGNCCSIPAQKTTKQIFFTIWSQSQNTDSDLKVHALHYANDYSYASDLPFKSFCKLAKRAETIRNYQKQVLVMIKHCLGSNKLTRYRSKQFYYRTFSVGCLWHTTVKIRLGFVFFVGTNCKASLID